MSHGNELPKIIDKTQADIDAAIATIQNSDIPASTKDFVISCINLAVWLHKALNNSDSLAAQNAGVTRFKALNYISLISLCFELIDHKNFVYK